ncbi:NAD-dependent epimerase/dehydratase family protein [Candidatus Parcubacteria bacterium]|nr:NAD-dependent epimerase/dehydratase family protein [Candidatus Parcubacteria bacterium]
MVKTIVTGGAGFIGSHLVDALIKQGDEVLVLDNLLTGKKENVNPQAKLIEVDICNLEAIKPHFTGVDFVFHLAALPRVPISVENPVLTSQINIMGTINVFEAARLAKVKRVISTSSSSAYGNQATLPLKEEMLPNPVSPYGLQKLVGEKFAQMYSSLYQMNIVSIRPFNVYGPRIDATSGYSLVLGVFLKQKQEGKPLTIQGDGEQTRGYCFVADLVKAFILASKSEKVKGGEVINAGSDKAYSINYLAQLIGGKKVYGPERPGDIKHTQADTSKALELLGWQPETDFKEGVEITKEWFAITNKL